MIVYSPLDGDALTTSIPSNPRHCFLMTRLGKPVPAGVARIRKVITRVCAVADFNVIDASSKVTGRDFLLKIWRLIASTPLSVGICHEDIPPKTQANIWYELGVAQALGKETLIVKSIHTEVSSDFVRTEYIEFDDDFEKGFTKYLESLDEQADRLRNRAKEFVDEAGLQARAKNSVEVLAAAF